MKDEGDEGDEPAGRKVGREKVRARRFASRESAIRNPQSALARLGGQMDRQEGEFETVARALLTAQANALADQAKPLVEKVAAGEAKAIVRLADLKAPDQGDYEEFVRSFLEHCYQEARQAAARELGRPDSSLGPSPGRSRETAAVLQARAALIAADHASELKFSFTSRLLNDLQAGMEPQTALEDARQEFTNRATALLDTELNAEAIRIVQTVVSG